MRASDLAELAAFDAVARHLSFRRAAEERGVTASALSHAVSALEARVGLRLLNRTTRSVSLTDAGARLQAGLRPAFEGIGAALEELNTFRDTPFGRVRLNVPNSLASFVLGPVLGPVLAAHPHLKIEVAATDRRVDIVAEGFDAGIRLGESLAEGMIAVRIRPRLRLIVVASPAYLSARPPIRTPADLDGHEGIRSLYPNGNPYPWTFQQGDVAVEWWPQGRLALDDHALIVEAACSGAGLGYAWEPHAAAALAASRLMQVLDDWCPPEDWLHLYFPSRRHMSAGLRVVVEALRA